MDEEGSFWDDWEDDRFGEMDTEENREQYPEGFKWTCCGSNGNAIGCQASCHVADDRFYVEAKKRRKYPS